MRRTLTDRLIANAGSKVILWCAANLLQIEGDVCRSDRLEPQPCGSRSITINCFRFYFPEQPIKNDIMSERAVRARWEAWTLPKRNIVSEEVPIGDEKTVDLHVTAGDEELWVEV